VPQGLLRSTEGADREWAAAQAAALPLTALVDAGAAHVAVLAAAARGPCTAHSRPGVGSVFLLDPNPIGGGGGGALARAEQALQELLEVYAERWVEFTRHPARHQRRRRFGHAALAAGAGPAAAGAAAPRTAGGGGGGPRPSRTRRWRGVACWAAGGGAMSGGMARSSRRPCSAQRTT